MAKQIIILERVNQPSDQDFRYVMWATVPATRKQYYVNPNFVSQYKDITAEELAALRDGSIVEQVGIIPRPTGTTIAQIRAELIVRFNLFQNSIINYNPYERYGTYYDGSTWTAGGVA